jgi:hypothetical protein
MTLFTLAGGRWFPTLRTDKITKIVIMSARRRDNSEVYRNVIEDAKRKDCK